MSSQVTVANRLMPQVLSSLSSLYDKSQFVKLSEAPNAQSLYRDVSNLKTRFLNDRLLQNFLKMSREAGMESLAKELSIRAVSRLKSYSNDIEKLNNEVQRISVVKSLGSQALGFWPFSDSSGDTEAERSAGTDMLRAYFDTAKNYENFKYSDFDSYLASVNAVISDYPQFIGNLVFLNKLSTSVNDAISRIKDLAVKSEGKARLQDITQAAGGSGDTTNWTELVTSVATETAKEVGTKTVNALETTGNIVLDTVENVGEGAKSLSSIIKYWPYVLIIVGGVIIYYYMPKKGRS